MIVRATLWHFRIVLLNSGSDIPVCSCLVSDFDFQFDFHFVCNLKNLKYNYAAENWQWNFYSELCLRCKRI